MSVQSGRYFLLAGLTASIAACEPRKSADARTVGESTQQAQSAGAAAATPTLPAATKAAAYRFITGTEGNSARYRIREQLVGVDFPNDAVGETKNVSGVISADKKGNVIPAESKFIVDVSNLTSDKDRRDGFVKHRVLQTDQYPTVTLVPTKITGISTPLPASGTKNFTIVGDLTVRGVTHSTTWNVTAQFRPNGFNGKASTSFTFKDFAIEQPRVPVVLSVADTIKLELDFAMQTAGKK
jgi:polyisoprenoid-binding protein YceI